ncbi:MAG: hypothetical protein R6V49_07380, partial [Bacteroidales bacterium]
SIHIPGRTGIIPPLQSCCIPYVTPLMLNESRNRALRQGSSHHWCTASDKVKKETVSQRVKMI